MIIDSPENIFLRLTEIANNFEPNEENYLIAYPYFLEYFKKIDTITPENIIIGISFTYSWMPTILNLNPKKRIEFNKLLNKSVLILNRIKNQSNNEDKITFNELLTLKELFNNSLVGSSKLLHFINPEKYAIWDSKVYQYLYINEKPHKYKLEKPSAYIKYLEFIEVLVNDENFEEFYLLMKQKVQFEISKYRALELAFFKGI